MAKRIPGRESGSRGCPHVTVRAAPGTSRSLLSGMVERVLGLGAPAAADPEAAKAAAAAESGAARLLLRARVFRPGQAGGSLPWTYVTVGAAVPGCGGDEPPARGPG